MKKLIINTANDELYLVVKNDDEIFFSLSEAGVKHNEAMLSMIDELLKKAGTRIREIDEFGVVIGPGSFTGIRVGISMVKAFRDVLKVKAKGINNLDYLFSLARVQNKEIETVAILGSRNSYFVATIVNGMLYKYERNLSLEELKVVANDKPIGMFKADADLNCFVVDNNAQIFLEEHEKSLDENLLPVYYQLSQAENEKLKRGNVEVLPADKVDLDEIYEIEKQSIHRNSLKKEEIQSFLSDENYKIFKVEFENAVVGFVILQLTDEANIVSIAVKKEFRNLGLATKLIEKSEEFSRNKNINALSLEVSEKNITAYLLYKKLGFVERRKRKSYYDDGSDAIEMIKMLK